MNVEHSDAGRIGRRRLLATVGAGAAAASAGCMGVLDRSTDTPDSEGDGPIFGSGPVGDRTVGGTSIADMPALSGEVTVYSGRGEALVGELLSGLEEFYDDLALDVRYAGSTELVNQIVQEGSNSRADVFYSVNAGALGALADRGRTVALPDDVLTNFVREEFRSPDGQWLGTSGRARSIPFNTDELSADEVPTSIYEFPEDQRFADAMGWAPTYGSFQAFVTAMRLLDGEQRAREWLTGMLDHGVAEYADEFRVSQAVANGELTAGFANHYYSLRVLAGRPDAPLDVAFTENDPGAIFNVAGAAVVDTADDESLAANFVRHLLSGEAQDYFARTTFEYPLIPEVEPVGQLPTIDELSPPEGLDLATLSDLEPTVQLMRDVGVL